MLPRTHITNSTHECFTFTQPHMYPDDFRRGWGRHGALPRTHTATAGICLSQRSSAQGCKQCVAVWCSVLQSVCCVCCSFAMVLHPRLCCVHSSFVTVPRPRLRALCWGVLQSIRFSRCVSLRCKLATVPRTRVLYFDLEELFPHELNQAFCKYHKMHESCKYRNITNSTNVSNTTNSMGRDNVTNSMRKAIWRDCCLLA